MLSAVFLIISLIHLLFVVLAVRLYVRNRSIYTALAAMVMIGLFYDNFIVGIGSSLREGSLLRGLNWWRFAIHALVTPVLIMFAIATAQRLHIRWAQSRTAFAIFGLLTLLLILWGVYMDIIKLSLTAVQEAGTLRYIHVESAGPPIPAIMTVIVMIVVGGFVWWRHKWAILCIGSSLMFILAGAGASILILSNIGEVLFAGAILWTDYKLGDLVGKMAADANLVGVV